MSHETTIIESLKAKGYRITKGRTAIVDALLQRDAPVSALELHALLKKKGLSVNTVTVYRELAVLEKEGHVHGEKFKDGTKRYCLESEGHHHHLICTGCDAVQDIEMDHDLDAIEKKIGKEKAFTVQSHALEFYGLCAECS